MGFFKKYFNNIKNEISESIDYRIDNNIDLEDKIDICNVCGNTNTELKNIVCKSISPYNLSITKDGNNSREYKFKNNVKSLLLKDRVDVKVRICQSCLSKVFRSLDKDK